MPHVSSLQPVLPPCECDGRITAFEAVGRGSIPRWGNGSVKSEVRRVKRNPRPVIPDSDFTLRTSNFFLPPVFGVCRIAREPAKLVDQVRFLARTFLLMAITDRRFV